MAQGFDAGLDLDQHPAVDVINDPDISAPQTRIVPKSTALIMHAIVEDAMRLLTGAGSLGTYTTSGKIQVINDTLDWLHSDYDGPFSFRTICAVFRLNLDLAREQIITKALRELPAEYGWIRRLIWLRKVRVS